MSFSRLTKLSRRFGPKRSVGASPAHIGGMGLSGGKRAWKSRRFCRVKKSGGIMAEENGGKRAGLIDRVLAAFREAVEDIRRLVREKGKEEIERAHDSNPTTPISPM